MATRLADDFAAIREGLKRLEAERCAVVNGPVEEQPTVNWDNGIEWTAIDWTPDPLRVDAFRLNAFRSSPLPTYAELLARLRRRG